MHIPLKFANAGFLDDLGQYFNAIVPVGYDPAKPVGTGAFMYESFTAGQQSVFKKFPNYWQKGKPYADQLTIIDFTDDTARVNALLGGQVEAIDNLPTGQIAQVQGNSSLKVLISHTGQWQPFTMRIDQAPFSDVRVRQAMRLIVNRPQMVEQVLSGQGRVANDMYAPFDPAYDSTLPQRAQDIAQAKSLLKSAGHAGLGVQLVTAPVFQGVVQAAQVFAQQASAAGVKVNLRKLDTGTFYGPNYLKWTFAQDFWATREYLPQVAQGSLPSSPFNETHWGAGKFEKLINQARAELDATKRDADPARGREDGVRPGRLHHPLLLQPDRRLQRQAGRLRGGQVGLPAGQLLVQERGVHRLAAPDPGEPSAMSRFLLRRILLGLLILLLVSIVVFAATQALPGNAARAILGRNATPARLAALTRQLHLNESAVSQYFHWLGGVITGNFGTSAATEQPVSSLLSARILNSAFLVLVSALVALPLSIGLGVWMAVKRDKPTDHILSIATLSLAALPEFVIGIGLIVLFATNVSHTRSPRSRSSRRASTRGTFPTWWCCPRRRSS